VAVGDFNGDGIPDLVTANQFSGSVSVLLGNGDGSFRPHVDYAVGSPPFSVAVGDFNGDGIPDLVTANGHDNTVSVLRNAADWTGFQWTGQGSDDLWSDGANWLGGSAPTAGADLLFPSGAAQLTTVDDLGFALHSLTTDDNYRVSGQPLTLSGNLMVQQGALELDNPATVSGTTTIAGGATLSLAGGGSLTVASGLTVNGTLDVGDSTGGTSGAVNFTATQTVGGSGAILLGGSAGNTLAITSPNTQVTFGTSLTVHGASGSLLVLDATDSYVNNGVLADDVLGGHLYLDGTWTNNGTFRAQNGGWLEVDSSPTNYTPDGTLTGGTWQVYDDSTLFVQFAAPIRTNAATVLLDGPLSNFQGVSYTDALFYLLTNAGSLTLRDGRQLTIADTGSGFGFTNTATGTLLIGDTQSQFTVMATDPQGRALTNLGTFVNTGQVSLGGDFVNAGAVQLLQTSTVCFTTSANGYTQVAGSTTLVGGTLNVPVPVNLQGGTLSGVGTINGDLTNAAQVFVGFANSTGTLTVTGNYTQTAAGTLTVSLAGVGAADQLAIGGLAALDGTLDVMLIGGYAPATGDSFAVLAFGSTDGSMFAALGGDAGLFTVYYDPMDVTLVAY
jgi:hypothetical protein